MRGLLASIRVIFQRPTDEVCSDDKSGRGRFGEEQAALFLQKTQRFRILLRNWRCGRDELDIIAMDGDVLVFVEVRTRSADSLVQGFYTVDAKKKTKALRACRAYLRSLRAKPTTFRYDVVEVRLLAEGGFDINHYERVPLFPKGYVG